MTVAAIATEPVTAAETDAPLDFHAAFEAAKAQHTPAVETAAETETEDDETTATKGETETVAGETKPVVSETKPETGLISDDEFKALQTKHADDPLALRKSLEGAFTKKTQALAAERTSLERLKQYVPLIDAYEADAEGTLARLAEMNGLALVPKTEAPTTATATDTDTTALVEQRLAKFRTKLGPELEYLADALEPAVRELVEEVARESVEKSVEPLRAQTNGLLAKVGVGETDGIMKAFTARHPDWQDHEPAMMAFAKKVNPGEMTEGEFLDLLYETVTRETPTTRQAHIDREVAKEVKKHLDKMTTVASTTETRSSITPEAQVRKRPAGPVDFQQAAKDAIAGIRYED